VAGGWHTGPAVEPPAREYGWRLSAWCENHHHLAAFESGFALDLGDLIGIGLDAKEQFPAELLVRHFPAPEAQRHLYFVAFVKEADHRLHFHFVVVIIDVRPHLDLFDLDRLLLLASLGGFLLFLVFEFAVVENFSDRRVCIGRDLDEI
jgi:hypothetical protein